MSVDRLHWLDAITGTKLGWDPSPLDVSERAVCLALLAHMNRHGECRVSQRTLMVGSGLARQTVADAVERLEQRGFLVVRRAVGRAGNTYAAAIPEGSDTPVSRARRASRPTR